jgi:hypothetical protein
MAHLRPQFEKELLNRVKLRSTSHVSEEQVLIKAFRYFDLNSTGTVTRDQFIMALDKLGMQILAKEVIYHHFILGNLRDLPLLCRKLSTQLQKVHFPYLLQHDRSFKKVLPHERPALFLQLC